ncbi:tetratricopeptide repeat protein [Neomicrococcus aestuarii]|uniref:tetratricopeptide repeat protein n=1 Tax=Neomicrococcus aestuarii TaxID=556325 RepID=UPI001E38A0DA|nr:tetratricopeptide repeat protein [Neomicrococcus aestuarii]
MSESPVSATHNAAPEPHIASARGAVDLSAAAQSSAGSSQYDAAASVPHSPAVSGRWRVAVNEASFQQVLQLSNQVPVVISFGTPRHPGSAELDALLARLVDGYEGRVVLATVDADANQNILQAFRLQQVPAVVAVLGGRPVPLFQGAPAEAEIKSLLDELMTLALQNGITGTVPPVSAEEPSAAPKNPLHAAADEAMASGDYEGAVTHYNKALAEKPNDLEAQQGLKSAELLHRVSSMDANAVRAEGAQSPDSLDAQLAVADLDVAGGHVEDAFRRIISFIATHFDDERESARERLVDLFTVVGASDPRVSAARQKLARTLY